MVWLVLFTVSIKLVNSKNFVKYIIVLKSLNNHLKERKITEVNNRANYYMLCAATCSYTEHTAACSCHKYSFKV